MTNNSNKSASDSRAIAHRLPDWSSVVGGAMLAALVLPAESAHAVYAYECGNPNLSANNSEQIAASDALIILKKAVGQDVDCLRCICDVNNSGSVLASDAQTVLRKAVGQSVALNCFQDNNECTECTSSGLKTKLESGLVGPLMGEETWVLFKCADGSTIPVDLSPTWPEAGVVVNTNGAVISGHIPGETRNIAIQPSTACTCGTPPGWNTFLSLEGDDITVKGLSIRNFRRGITMSGSVGTVGGDLSGEDVGFSGICDYAIKNDGGDTGGRGSEVRNTTVTGKCVTGSGCSVVNKGPTISGSLDCSYPAAAYDRNCYHVSYHDVDFANCQYAIFAYEAAATNSHILVSGGSMSGGAAPACIGNYLRANGLDVTFKNWISTSCDTPIEALGTSSVDVISSAIDGSKSRGIRLKGGADLVMNCTQITDTDNNDGTACPSECGAVAAVGDGATAMLGTTATSDAYFGKNYLTDNYRGTTPRDIYNFVSTTYDIYAQKNYWGGGAPSQGDQANTSMDPGTRIWNNNANADVLTDDYLTSPPVVLPATCSD